MPEPFKPYEGPEPYIFVSYASLDRDQVFPVLDDLREQGFRIWRDVGGVTAGVKWMRTIQEHVDRAAVCLLFWSEASSVSQHCAAEIERMIMKNKEILPVRLDDTPYIPGPEMYLERFQSVKREDFENNTAFAEYLGQQESLAPCKEDPERWHQDWQIQWKMDKGVLIIAENEKFQDLSTHIIPDYSMLNYADTWNETEKAFTCSAPWMKSRENILAVVIQKGVSTIGSRAFQDCSSLTSVKIPSSVTTINTLAFAGCSALTSVIIPDSVTEISLGVFDGCSSLTSVTIPDSVTTIGKNAFSGCWSLTSVAIPDSVTTIDNFAFSLCSSLTSVTIPDSVTAIGNRAFAYCENLKFVEIPAGATYVESGDNASFPPHTQVIRRPPPQT